jgi:hypothetical protein
MIKTQLSDDIALARVKHVETSFSLYEQKLMKHRIRNQNYIFILMQE